MFFKATYFWVQKSIGRDRRMKPTVDTEARVEDFVWRYDIEALKNSFTRSRDVL